LDGAEGSTKFIMGVKDALLASKYFNLSKGYKDISFISTDSVAKGDDLFTDDVFN